MSDPQANILAQLPYELDVSRPINHDGGNPLLPEAPPNGKFEPTQPSELSHLSQGVHDASYGDGHTAPATSTLDLPALTGVGAKALLGFEINLNADGLTADLSMGPFGELLGFDARLSADGIFAGVNLGLPAAFASAESLVAETASTVDSALQFASAELGNILALDSHLGAALLPELLGSDHSLITQSVKATLAEVTGVQVFGGLGEPVTSQLINNVANVAAGAVAQITDSVSGAELGGLLTKTHVLSEISDISRLSLKGDVSSGDVINFPLQPLGHIDELFAGTRYTDYNVSLQSQKSGAADEGIAASNVVSVTTDITTAIIDAPFGNHHEATPAVNDPSHDSLLHTSLSVLHLTSH
jgi:hypothetical protein